jgi:hypothetical protein
VRIRIPWISRLLLAAAATLAAPFFFLHLAGWRENAAILSGTLPAGGETAMWAGAAYVLLYAAMVTVVPVTVLWALLYSVAASVAEAREAAR